MNLLVLAKAVLKLAEYELQPIPKVNRTLLKGLTIGRTVDIKTATFHDTEQNPELLFFLNSSVPYVIQLVVNGDYLWCFKHTKQGFSVVIFDLYTNKLIQRMFIRVPLDIEPEYILTVYETAKGTIWIVCHVNDGSGGIDYCFMEVDIKTLQVLRIDKTKESEEQFMITDTLVSDMVFDSFFRKATFESINTQAATSFIDFHRKNIITKETLQGLKCMVDEYFGFTDPDGYSIHRHYMSKHLQILLMRKDDFMFMIICKDMEYRVVDLKFSWNYKILIRGDGAILLYNYISNRFEIFC